MYTLKHPHIRPRSHIVTAIPHAAASLSLACILLQSGCTYMPTPWEVPDTLVLTENRERLILTAKSGLSTQTGLMFYQGGLVDAHAYLPALAELAEAGVAVVIPKVPGNLVAFDADAGLRQQDAVPGVTQWILGGHSLGSAMAGFSVYDHPDAYVGLLMLTGMNTAETPLTDWDHPVLCITASRDGVLRAAVSPEERLLLPPGVDIDAQNEGYPTERAGGYTVYRVIEGGNHSQFGSYGAQAGDLTATISEAEQHHQLTEAVLTFMEKNQWDTL